MSQATDRDFKFKFRFVNTVKTVNTPNTVNIVKTINTANKVKTVNIQYLCKSPEIINVQLSSFRQ